MPHHFRPTSGPTDQSVLFCELTTSWADWSNVWRSRSNARWSISSSIIALMVIEVVPEQQYTPVDFGEPSGVRPVSRCEYALSVVRAHTVFLRDQEDPNATVATIATSISAGVGGCIEPVVFVHLYNVRGVSQIRDIRRKRYKWATRTQLIPKKTRPHSYLVCEYYVSEPHNGMYSTADWIYQTVSNAVFFWKVSKSISMSARTSPPCAHVNDENHRHVMVLRRLCCNKMLSSLWAKVNRITRASELNANSGARLLDGLKPYPKLRSLDDPDTPHRHALTRCPSCPRPRDRLITYARGA